MLAGAYSIDLSGIPLDRIGAGAVRIARTDVKQVLPRAGRYPVTCAGAVGAARGEIEIGESSLTLECPTPEGASSVMFEYAT